MVATLFPINIFPLDSILGKQIRGKAYDIFEFLWHTPTKPMLFCWPIVSWKQMCPDLKKVGTCNERNHQTQRSSTLQSVLEIGTSFMHSLLTYYPWEEMNQFKMKMELIKLTSSQHLIQPCVSKNNSTLTPYVSKLCYTRLSKEVKDKEGMLPALYTCQLRVLRYPSLTTSIFWAILLRGSVSVLLRALGISSISG